MADREDLINQIYYQELGRLQADQPGLDYWNSDQMDTLDDTALRNQIRSSAGLSGESVTQPLLADSGYNAFLRKMQFDESSIQSSLQAAQEAARRRVQGQAGMYDTQRDQSARNTNQSFESRGMFRSGEKHRQLMENRAGIDRNQVSFEQGVGESNAELERNAASEIAGLRRQRAEQELGARDRLTQRSVTY